MKKTLNARYDSADIFEYARSISTVPVRDWRKNDGWSPRWEGRKESGTGRTRTTVERSNNELKEYCLSPKLYSRGKNSHVAIRLAILLFKIKRIRRTLQREQAKATWPNTTNSKWLKTFSNGAGRSYPNSEALSALLHIYAVTITKRFTDFRFAKTSPPADCVLMSNWSNRYIQQSRNSSRRLPICSTRLTWLLTTSSVSNFFQITTFMKAPFRFCRGRVQSWVLVHFILWAAIINGLD